MLANKYIIIIVILTFYTLLSLSLDRELLWNDFDKQFSILNRLKYIYYVLKAHIWKNLVDYLGGPAVGTVDAG